MTEIVIDAQGLGKRYALGSARPATTFMDAFSTWFQRAKPAEAFWAVKDASFQIRRGETVGIVGHNGAGKSTLLKLLCRITEPTEGQALIRGRVGSLLEVGTGFHPELTGRENVALAGAILGMTGAEIRRKFDAIAAFAEIDRFLDTPVKHYSSGMYVRLAFSVAVHLEPEVLLVDEVLAVGDVRFQQKCLKAIRELTRSGRTILLVSHNLAAIQSACSRALLLEEGRVTADGRPTEVLERYRESLERRSVPESAEVGPISIRSVEILDVNGTPTRVAHFGEPWRVRIRIEARERLDRPMINLGLRRGDGVIVCNFNNWYDNFRIDYAEGLCTLEGWLPPLRLVPDHYEVHAHVWHWGGGHLEGNAEASRAITGGPRGELRVEGPALNWHDGVFQTPAVRWQFQRGDSIQRCEEVAPSALESAFRE
jgi:lipopolysaccharide transport system ATP-binding protein